MRLYIKHMVCNRCVAAVQQAMQTAGVAISNIQLGQVETIDDIPEQTMRAVEQSLVAMGFELMDDRRSSTIERIKSVIAHVVAHAQDMPEHNLSEHISAALHHDYKSLSNLFSEVEGITIEKYFIKCRVERVKELLMYSQDAISQIAFDMGYSSVAHLSNQFRQMTGMTPSQFRAERQSGEQEEHR